MFQPDFADAPAAARTWTRYCVPQGWSGFSTAEHRCWDALYARQVALLQDRIVSPFLDGLDALALGDGGIPELEALSDRLEPQTGWRLVSVPGIVPDADFFAMLAERRFPIGNFIRDPAHLDYLEEPDCFHDIFGHVPLLAHGPAAQLMEALGRLGVDACAIGQSEWISRLYWHSVEFGLALEHGAVKILGAGLASSFGEATHALEADVPRPRFTVEAAAATAYRSDSFQPLYFVADSLESAAFELGGLGLTLE